MRDTSPTDENLEADVRSQTSVTKACQCDDKVCEGDNGQSRECQKQSREEYVVYGQLEDFPFCWNHVGKCEHVTQGPGYTGLIYLRNTGNHKQ